METKGYLAIILHAHLPYVRHPEREGMLEERWLFEAITDCYLPLLDVFSGWERDGVDGRVAMSLTPTLASMLDDELLRQRYRRFLDGQLELAGRELDRTRGSSLERVAWMYHERLGRAHQAYVHDYGSDLVTAFGRLAAAGRIEIMGSAATHGYLPLLGLSRPAARAQVNVGVDHYRRSFGHVPTGFWLPECGYSPGDDELLAAAGVRYFVSETHGIMHASVRPRYGVYAPLYCPSGVAAFGRDTETSKQVWSANEGYPGDYLYREFYRDIGYDLDLDYLEPYLPPGRLRTHTGFKYYRITGPGEHKEVYDPDRAREKASEHAGNFTFNRGHQVGHLASIMDRPPIIVAPYDAELFGHWWFEGPEWLDRMVRGLGATGVRALTPGDYLKLHRRNQVAVPSMSSWGYRGFNEVWLEGSNDWVYRHLHLASDRMGELAAAFPGAWGILQRALNQAARELLLASASDWPFIMKANTVVGYARKRVCEHVDNFNRLRDQIVDGRIDEGLLADLERHNNVFPGINYRHFSGTPVTQRDRDPAVVSS